MGGHIDLYLDCVSPYSYVAFTYLLKNRDLLASHGVDVDYEPLLLRSIDFFASFHPIFLGGVNVGSGNKPPWTLPAKAKYGKFAFAQTKKYHNIPDSFTTPPFFPILSLTPQRAMCYIKDTFPQPVYEAAFLALWPAMWTLPHRDISSPVVLAAVLSSVNVSGQGNPAFSGTEMEAIIHSVQTVPVKERLSASTQKALELGAFGAPWAWVRNARGEEQPFFGSDRFPYMWQFLGIPFQDIEVLPRL